MCCWGVAIVTVSIVARLHLCLLLHTSHLNHHRLLGIVSIGGMLSDRGRVRISIL